MPKIEEIKFVKVGELREPVSKIVAIRSTDKTASQTR